MTHAQGGPDAASPEPRPRRRGLVVLIALGLGALVVLAVLGALRLHGAPPRQARTPSTQRAPAGQPGYVGADACKGCHAKEYDSWLGSHHQLAMQPATEASVLGDFRNAHLTHFKVTSRFFRRDDRFFVNTDGADGKPADFEVRYTFGVYPLQQYLVVFPDGRLQALPTAWDARPKDAGGQRWFHLYPGEPIPAGDELHWTGLQQNWNFMCAECHSTDLRKNYDAATNTFHTTWKDISVACEACHGAGSDHVAWARQQAAGSVPRASTSDGLLAHFDDRHGVRWIPDPATGNASRSRPRANTMELEACGRCHARAAKISEDWRPGQPLTDTHRVSVLEPGLYTADGQMQGEVYNYGSFLQSRMYAAGVTCSDCHDPHTLKLRIADGEVCSQCHSPAKYAATSHHHHREQSPEASCPACHMPVRTYMGVHRRHDHSFRIPRPDESVAFGTPNACNDCHADKPASWAAGHVTSWYGEKTHAGWQHFTAALSAARSQAAQAGAGLVRLAGDASSPGIARATAIGELGPYLDSSAMEAARKALASSDPLERLAAAELLAATDAPTRWELLEPLLADPVLSVRSAAAGALADAVPADATGAQRHAFDAALAEFIGSQQLNADRPEAHLALGNLYATQGKPSDAATEYRQALRLWPGFIPGYVNLADLARAGGHDDEAERWLDEAHAKAPSNATVLSALGLLRVRQHRTAEALALLARASRAAPDDPHLAYVYAVGLYSSGSRREALALLERTHDRFPGNREVLLGLASLAADAGDTAAAKRYAEAFIAIAPADARGPQLLRGLEARGAPP